MFYNVHDVLIQECFINITHSDNFNEKQKKKKKKIFLKKN